MFLNELAKTTNKTLTENGAVTNKSTLDPALDLFALGGALRGRIGQFNRLFRFAYAEEPLTALRTLFYLRDVRGGQGERELFRAGLRQLVERDRPTFLHNLELIPEFGRWDDIFATGLTPPVTVMIQTQLDVDITHKAMGDSISLLAKWLPSENASSPNTRALAREVIEALGYTSRRYRKTLSDLRGYIKLLEQDMSANQWEDIDFGKLPSQAHYKHVKAFNRHTPQKYAEYLASVTRGEAKLSAGTLFAHQVYDAAAANRPGADEMWAALPDYTNGSNALVMADVSGSMWGLPISISVSLALYFAERNQGPFNGYFMTFSGSPQLVKVRGTTLRERLADIESSEWGVNTNLWAAFQAVLKAAIDSEASPEELPRVLYIISDMEFDQCVHTPGATLFDAATAAFQAHGYQLPHVVFWNVNARQQQAPVTVFDNNVTLISGGSQSTFQYAMEGKTPRQLMDEVVNSQRYSIIELA